MEEEKMKKNIFKKAGRVFTSLALAVSICLTMSVSVFAKNGNDLKTKTSIIAIIFIL